MWVHGMKTGASNKLIMHIYTLLSENGTRFIFSFFLLGRIIALFFLFPICCLLHYILGDTHYIDSHRHIFLFPFHFSSFSYLGFLLHFFLRGHPGNLGSGAEFAFFCIHFFLYTFAQRADIISVLSGCCQF